jgi:hypothetical protein
VRSFYLREPMFRIVVFIILSVCLLPGCRRAVVNADADQAGPALRTALEAWKNGKSPGDLESQSPSIIMNEGDWESGKRLLDFKMDEKSTLVGRQIRWQVQVKLQDKGGKTQDRRVMYTIDTTPRIVIVRDVFGS